MIKDVNCWLCLSSGGSWLGHQNISKNFDEKRGAFAPLFYGLIMCERPQHNYCARQYFVKNRLKMLIYISKLRFFACFCLVLASLATLCRGLCDQLMNTGSKPITQIMTNAIISTTANTSAIVRIALENITPRSLGMSKTMGMPA
jgi:hypothetical protein